MMYASEIYIAQEHHVLGILEIYSKIVLDSHTSFEYEIPDADEMWKRIQGIQKDYPFLVCVQNKEVLGYAYASRLRGRKAYDWSAEVSVYVAETVFRQGIGKMLYNILVKQLKWQNIHSVFAGIALPNDASVMFHKNFGFQYLGTYSKIGFKKERWIDVAWYQLRIKESINPSPTKPWKQRSSLIE